MSLSCGASLRPLRPVAGASECVDLHCLIQLYNAQRWLLCCLVSSCDPSLVPMHPPISWPVADLHRRWHRSELWFKTSQRSQWLSVHQITTLAALRGPAADIIRPGSLCPVNFLPHSFTPFSACQWRRQVEAGNAAWPQRWPQKWPQRWPQWWPHCQFCL